MTAARAAGVPVAEVHDHGEDALGRAYLLVERLDGETIPRRLLRDDAYAAARPGLARRLGEVLARIHQIDPGRVPGLPRVDALGQLTELYEGFAEPRPAIEIGLRWLAEHRPRGRRAVVHGDFRTGNLIVGEDGLRGVLDWELAHRGDPREDLGWLCAKAWRFGSPQPAGGFGPRADLMAGYAEGGGTPPDGRPSGGGRCTARCAGRCSAAGRPNGTCPAPSPRWSSRCSAAGSASRSTTCCSRWATPSR